MNQPLLPSPSPLESLFCQLTKRQEPEWVGIISGNELIAHDKGTIAEEQALIDLQKILILLKNQTGYDFSLYKPTIMLKRIDKRLESLGIDTLSTYLYYLHHHPNEINILFKRLLIHVTRFFRDSDAFERLKCELLNNVLKNHPVDTCFRIWMPACSTGEEAYSIAIMMHECMRILNIQLEVRIFATDVSEHAIGTAREGLFSTSIEKDVSPERLEHYFIKTNGFYKISPSIRKVIVFAIQDIVTTPPIIRLNLLCCRNLLIYLEPSLQKKIITLFQSALNHNGLLFLGPSENACASKKNFSVVNQRWRIYKREKKTQPDTQLSIKSNDYRHLNANGVEVNKNKKTHIETKLSSLVKKVLNNDYTPSIIIIDENMDIIYLYGRTSKYLELPSGEMRLQFMRMIRSDLKPMVNLGISKAISQQEKITLHQLKMSDSEKNVRINVTIEPIKDIELSDSNLILIIIEDALEPAIALASNCHHGIEEKCDAEIRRLQTEIEELSSIYEESQATNEEMQSLNEELIKLNMELENNKEHLSSENEELKNLLDHSEIATIFLDKNLCIKQFTKKTTDIIHLIPADLGRPIAHLESNLLYNEFIDDARTVLRTQKPIINEKADKKGDTYRIKMSPHHSSMSAGLVITFINLRTMTEPKIKPIEAHFNQIPDSVMGDADLPYSHID